MHEDRTDHYIGAANEAIPIDATQPNAGTLTLNFNSHPISTPATVNFSATSGVELDLVATLVGPAGSHCAISIDNVDGGKDIKVLLVGTGASHDTIILEFATLAAPIADFVKNALKVPGAKK